MKPEKIALITFILSAFLFIIGICAQKYNRKSQIAGGFAFANSYTKTSENLKFVMNDGKNTFSFFVEDGVWHLEEKSGYYADYNVLSFVLHTIKESQIYNYPTKNLSDFKFVPDWTISVYADGKKLDTVQIQSYKGQYLAKVNKDKKIYTISGYFDFPHAYEVWLRQPAIKAQISDIQELFVNNKLITRKLHENEFSSTSEFSKLNLNKVLTYTENLYFVNVLPKKDITEKNEEFKAIISLFSGLKYELTFYKTNNKYYVEIEMLNSIASEIGVREYIEKNKMLYENWIFEIDQKIYNDFLTL